MLGDKGRFSKSVFYDGSVKVPVILRPPGGLERPAVCSGLTSTTDLTATLLDIAECEPQPNVFGRSLKPALENPESVGSDIVVSEIHDRTMIFDGRWKMVVNKNNELLKLFDKQEDPNESVNLAGREDTRGVVDHLRGELLGFYLRTAYRQHREING